MLYLVATPIGNLEDITLRALRIIKECDYLLCEDKRKTRILLDYYGIKKKIKAYHKFNEAKNLPIIIKDLQSNLTIAMLSDSGSPIICDPGFLLVKKCIEKEIAYTSVVGPSSVTNAYILSGFPESKWQFFGFFPKKNSERVRQVHQMAVYSGVSLAFITPHNVEQILKIFQQFYPKKELVIIREMTKKFETIHRGYANQLLQQFIKQAFKGEMVLAIEGFEKPSEDLSLKEMILLLRKTGSFSEKQAIEISAKMKNETKGQIYKKIKIKK